MTEKIEKEFNYLSICVLEDKFYYRGPGGKTTEDIKDFFIKAIIEIYKQKSKIVEDFNRKVDLILENPNNTVMNDKGIEVFDIDKGHKELKELFAEKIKLFEEKNKG